MCGIVGYTGPREAGPILIEGLRRLEYRGYDSAGIALVDEEGDLFVEKKAGKLANLQDAIADVTPHATIGLAHTRWATHGRPNDLNAHPHQDCTGAITVIHNGIIENFRELRDGLEARGHVLTSETDTEALAHLVEEAYQGDLADAVRASLQRVEGAYALVVMHKAEVSRLVGARHNVPLVVGLNGEESFIASDVSAILAHTNRVVFLDEGDVADVRPTGVVVTGVDGSPRERPVTIIDWTPEAAEKGGYEHFMLKEIHEQPEALRQSLAGRVTADGRIHAPEVDSLDAVFRTITRVEIVACGSASFAGLVGRGRDPGLDRAPGAGHRRLRVPLLAAAARREHARRRGHPVGRDGGHDRADPLRTRAGLPDRRDHEHRRLRDHPRGGRGDVPPGRTGDRGRGIQDVRDPGHDPHRARGGDRQGARGDGRRAGAGARALALRALPDAAARTLELNAEIADLARRYVNSRGFMFIGRGYSFPAALEGALKLKEISYMHAEGYAAGELKHGPISLLDAECPLVAVATRSRIYDKLISNVMEGRARDARVIAVATEGDAQIHRSADDILWVADTHEALSPALAVIPLQLFAYHTAVARGTDVDQPRNLAKSVTVE